MKFNDNVVHSEWEKITHGVQQGSILGHLLFLLYITDLPWTLNNISIPVTFADDNSVIITNKNIMNFQNKIIMVFDKLNKWSTVHQWALNYEKTIFIQFNISNSNNLDILINHGSQIVNTTNNTKFGGFTFDNTIN
jgi:hypothetical protein